MTQLLLLFLRSLGWFAGGVAVTSVVDKFVPDKLPAGTAPLTNLSDNEGKINWLKTGLVILFGAIGILIVRKLAKVLNIHFLK